LKGRPRQPHSAACRKRFEEILKDSDRMKRADARINEYLAKVLEKSDTGKKAKDPTAQDEGEPAIKKTKVGAEASDNAMPETGKTPAGAEAADEGMTQEPPPRGGNRPGASSGLSPAERAAASEEPENKRQRKSMKELINEMMMVDVEGLHDEDVDIMEVDGDGRVETYDEKTGELLDSKLVEEAEAEELEYMRGIDLYDEVDIQECLDRTGKYPVSVKWVDLNKGTWENPEIRCRLVARDFRRKGEGDREGLFAAMPPWRPRKCSSKEPRQARRC